MKTLEEVLEEILNPPTCHTCYWRAHECNRCRKQIPHGTLACEECVKGYK